MINPNKLCQVVIRLKINDPDALACMQEFSARCSRYSTFLGQICQHPQISEDVLNIIDEFVSEEMAHRKGGV